MTASKGKAGSQLEMAEYLNKKGGQKYHELI